MNTIDRIERVDLRTIWKHEARDFTVWLQDNADVLKDTIGIELVNLEREKSTGNFNVDLLAEDSSGNTVIIENQLEKSDHDHLGKIITYLTAFDAKKAIWIVKEPKQEHINAISWLNESTDRDFYLLKIEAIKIGSSNPAPLISLIVGPSEELKDVGSTKKVISERHRLRYKYWSSLLEISKQKHNLFSNISPTEYNWIGTSSGLRGVSYTYWVTADKIRIDLYIDRGKDSEEENQRVFQLLMGKKDEIESILGLPLVWLDLPQYRACIVRFEVEQSAGWKTNESEWAQSHIKAVDSMIKFESATKRIIRSIRI